MIPKLDDETLMAYADGALGPGEAAAVEAALAADPEAAATAARFRATGTLVRAAFDEALAEPVPPALARRVRAAARAAEAERHALAHQRRHRRELALAASVALLLGLGGGAWLARGGDGALPGLAAALATTPSGARVALPEGAALVPLATFRGRDGRWCRTFARIVDGGAGEGAACRDADDGWRLVFLLPDRPAGGRSGQAYAPAGEEPSLAEGLAGQLRGGEPLDAAQERDLIERRWR